MSQRVHIVWKSQSNMGHSISRDMIDIYAEKKDADRAAEALRSSLLALDLANTYKIGVESHEVK